MKVQLFIPCFVDQLSPQVGIKVYELLENVGCKVVYPPSQACCGQAGHNAGYSREATCVSNFFFKCFSPKLPIVVPSASCAAYIRQMYDQFYGGSSSNIHHNEFTYFPIYELSDFLCNVLGKADFSHISFSHKVGYHSSCASLREYEGSAHSSAIRLLKSVNGLELVGLLSSEECCGFGGSFSITHSAISGSMAKRKVDAAISAAPYLTSVDMSCLLHLEKYAMGSITILHIAEILSH